jgi:hypothetical protein
VSGPRCGRTVSCGSGTGCWSRGSRFFGCGGVLVASDPPGKGVVPGV